MRNRHKPGDYLAVDDESGLTHWASEMAYDWDGQFRHRSNLDHRHPQLDVKARKDPAPLKDVRPKVNAPAPCAYTAPFIGNSNVRTPLSRGATFAGISQMKIGGTCGPFVVY